MLYVQIITNRGTQPFIKTTHQTHKAAKQTQSHTHTQTDRQADKLRPTNKLTETNTDTEEAQKHTDRHKHPRYAAVIALQRAKKKRTPKKK